MRVEQNLYMLLGITPSATEKEIEHGLQKNGFYFPS